MNLGSHAVDENGAVSLSRAQQREAVDLIERLLDLVAEGNLGADGPAGAALVRRLEGALLALRALDRPNGPDDA